MQSTRRAYKKEFTKKIKSNIFSNFRIKVTCFLIAVLMYFVVSIFQLGSKTFVCKLNIDNMKDYLVISNNIPDTITVEVKEKKNIIDKITADDFNVRLDLKSIENPSSKVRIYILYNIPKQMSSLFGSIKLDPEYVDLNVEKLIEKKVEVKADTIGKPENGYTVKSIIIDPQRVMIQGPKTLIDSIDSIKTEVINIDGAKESFTIESSLISDNQNVKALRKVNVYFEIVKETNVYTYETQKLFYENLKNQFRAEINTSMQIKLEGNAAEFSNNLLDSLSYYVDCANITKPGDYELYIRVKNPNNLKIISIIPERIIVKIRNR